MDEYVDILDKEGKATGTVMLKSEAHKKGLFHPTVHVWIYTRKGEVLIQKRATTKVTYPNKWDVSVAGHISAGETPENSAVREIEEEIGLQTSKDELDKIGIHRSSVIHNKDLIDCEFHHVFLVELKQPIEKLRLQESEVAAVRLIDIDTYTGSLKDFSLMKNYVPHPPDYIDFVFSAIRRKIA